MAEHLDTSLSKRERQIMDAIYAGGRLTARQVQEALPEAPSYSAVRTLLRILEDKGHLRHERQGLRYVYVPTRSRSAEGKSAMRRVLETFFDGQVDKAMVAMLDVSDGRLSDGEYEALRTLIERARKEGR